jgi:hypothetical protein
MTTERLVTLVVLGGVLALGGCAKQLFPEDVPRSPYERYQMLRGQDRPKTYVDVFGVERPALRERLKPLGQP